MRIKRLIAVLLVMTTFMSIFGISASAENNHSDSIITISEIDSSGGTPCSGMWREKWDYSSSYIYNYPESGGKLKAWINSYPTNPSNRRYVDRWYCGIWGGQSVPYNGPTTTVWISQGVAKYMNNYCREDYYRYSGYQNAPITTTSDPYATAGFICWTEHRYYKIAWSPDSI